MCRVLAYIGPDLPLASLLLEPENSLINQTLDPETHPELQLAGWGFAAWGEGLLTPEGPFRYRRPMAAFFDDNAGRIIPSLQVNTLLAHVRAASYNSEVVLADENCHPFSYAETPWVVAQNGYLPGWTLLQRELLAHCEDRYLRQMRGNTDTEFLYVLLLSLIESDSNEDVQRGIEKMVGLIAEAMRTLDLPGLTKLKMALVAPGRIIGVNVGLGLRGETNPAGDWRELRKAEPTSDEFSLGMLLEPMYLVTGRNFRHLDRSLEVEVCAPEEATSAIFASEALTEDLDDWSTLEFGDIVFLERDGDHLTKTVRTLTV